MFQSPAELNNGSAIIERFQEFASEQSIEQVSHDLSNVMTLITTNIVRENSPENRERLFTYYLLLKNIDQLFKELNEQLTA
jgi:hypothetical protein